MGTRNNPFKKVHCRPVGTCDLQSCHSFQGLTFMKPGSVTLTFRIQCPQSPARVPQTAPPSGFWWTWRWSSARCAPPWPLEWPFRRPWRMRALGALLRLLLLQERGSWVSGSPSGWMRRSRLRRGRLRRRGVDLPTAANKWHMKALQRVVQWVACTRACEPLCVRASVLAGGACQTKVPAHLLRYRYFIQTSSPPPQPHPESFMIMRRNYKAITCLCLRGRENQFIAWSFSLGGFFSTIILPHIYVNFYSYLHPYRCFPERAK